MFEMTQGIRSFCGEKKGHICCTLIKIKFNDYLINAYLYEKPTEQFIYT